MPLPEAIFDKDLVAALIPQKAPLIMVNKLLSFTETSLESGLLVSPDNIFSHDGFFREPGIVEHMAQSVALHTGYKFHLLQQAAPTGYIGAISQLEIIALPKVGDELRTNVRILQEFGDITLVELSTSVDGLEVAKGQMKTVLAK